MPDETTVNQVAAIAHEANRMYCLTLGDTSQPGWMEAPEWQKHSARNGVMAHFNKDLTPEQSHELWLAQKRSEGWAYGPVKDADKKQHPCFRPYRELPQEQRIKDYLFRNIVHAFKEALNG